MKDRLNQTLGSDFEVLKPLGRGRHSEVYLAREISLDRLTAVKVLSSTLAEDEVAKARFEREAKAAASLNHPNATSVFRFGFLPEGLPYLVMQFVRGRTLEERLEAEGPVPVKEARRILRDLAAALAAAHGQGFVHRDVRVGNVMCDSESGRTLLTDFGVAGIIPTGKDDGPRLTQVGEILGEMKYMSPEQLEGEDATDAADLYALGILGYEILTGQGPYAPNLTGGLILAHLSASPRPLSTLREGVDPDMEALLERCLAKDPGKRPSAEFVQEVLSGDPGARKPPPPPEVHSGEGGVVGSLLRRRFPQIVVVTAGVGWVVLDFVTQQIEMGLLDQVWNKITLVTYLAGVAASGVFAWFHGARGKQMVRGLEVALYVVVAALWLLGCLAIFLP